MLDRISGTLHGLDPLVWWLLLLAVAGLLTGIVTGYLRARKIQPGSFKWAVFRREVVWAVANVSVTTITLGAVTGLLKAKGWITYNPEPAHWWVIALEYAIYFFGFDTWFYWWHRLMHIESVYKLTHKVHHQSISPNPITSLSMNPVEGVIEGAWLPLLTAVFTMHQATMLFVVPTAVIMGQYVHCGYEFLPRWWNRTWLTKWFISATFHDQHHRYFKGNYGGFTTIWDYVCGTVRPKYEADFAAITTRPVRRNEGNTGPDASGAFANRT
jgi:Delta7-sterol 5-desaturase